ncbi:hypothetical protein DICPUDRAFT_152284 [Dictyostelium purpureum]|uniref:Transmembrane protein n=1 Tax=Dictyostelium purpureum TaxID=5786 RepID=F0ZKY6_DICPU|nr:uncharacterized protein DICPUDRAFT_152284 [Dictyostelium purpureum]EGC35398.1 hypothetical protein DICPUDRAFT_152284 [Dictyostelium purpureum]|eukprot:XP_003288074.1 hypothetical protein DICPUDRAFT_152284 [Dictyostelium purpureum]
MRVYSIGSLLIFMGVWALLFVSFTNPWYHYVENYTFSGDTFRNYQADFYPTHVKVISSNLTTDRNYSYKEIIQTDFWTTKIPLNFTRYVKSSFSFAVLGWAVATGLIVLTFFDMNETEKKWVGLLGKILGFVVFVFTLLSFSLYVVFKIKLNDDCKSIYGSSSQFNCDLNGSESNHGFFNGKFFGSTKMAYWGGSSGWRCVVTACSLSLAGSIYNIFLFHKKK